MEKLDLNPEIVKSEDGKSAVVTFDKSAFDNYIGEELTKAKNELMEKAGGYVQAVATQGYTTAGTLFAENEDMSTVDIEAPIFREGDRFQAHVTRSEIDLVDTEDYVPAMKITQSITSAANVQSSVRTMSSTYREIMANKNK